MSLRIKMLGNENPFVDSVENFFTTEFPGANLESKGSLLDAITAAFLATNQIRYGPVPNPESLVAIREVIRLCIEAGKPIPVLTPFGSRKARLGEPLDVAEVMALKQLSCLQRRVTKFYQPGLTLIVRLEDASGHYLFVDDGEKSRRDTTSYCETFQRLVRILGFGFINPVLESSLFDEKEYVSLCDSIVPRLLAYITETDVCGLGNYLMFESWKALSALGWHGCIPEEQRSYYRNRYRAIYPGIGDRDTNMKLARYFAGSWARIQMNGTGALKEWGNDYIRVTFVSPIPGAPIGLTSKNIYYRTIPMKFAATHMPAWRAKGYLRLNDQVVPKLANWSDENDYQRGSMLFENGGERAEIRADFIVCD